jgi:myosin-crossreactive antigen
VLTKEETERFRGQTINIAKIKAQERKETAEKIYKQLQEHGTTYVKKWIKEQYGVEIKE